MKKWTVVIEINDYGEVQNAEVTDKFLDQYGIKDLVAIRDCPDYISYSICEAIEAPYGPQHPDGVFICDSSRHGNRRQ